jgi:hypothetical protein
LAARSTRPRCSALALETLLDLDFHSLQVLEAGFTQAEEWPPTSAERELLYAAICRHLAAHCPTRRSSSQSVAVALRLQKGEEVYAG